MTEQQCNVMLSGLGISSGLAVGQAFIYRDILHDLERYDIGTHQIEYEHRRIGRAVEKVLADLGLSAERVEAEVNTDLALIFHAHEVIETPAAALCVDEIKLHADFLSVGTNDLTQYTMAAGREDPLVSDYFRDDHPAVRRLLRLVSEAAGDTPLALCGELAGRVDTLPFLLATGIRTFSVAPPLVPTVKEAVRQIRIK